MKKEFKSWSWIYHEDNESVEILIQDIEKGWLSLATISNCPKGNLTDEEYDNKYNDLMTEVIDEAGYTSVWCR